MSAPSKESTTPAPVRPTVPATPVKPLTASAIPNPPPATISTPPGFQFDAVPPIPGRTLAGLTAPSLGPISAFAGNFQGNGFNTIFRPDNPETPTVLATPVTSDNILELNLTTESLAFSKALGRVPNRGTGGQGDIVLNGVPYLQSITDITNGPPGVGIHAEPGLWIVIPQTTVPAQGPTVARMGSIPHGTTVQAQGTSSSINGPPTIPSVDITPFVTGQTQTSAPIPFPSQIAANQGTARIPQDLSSFISAGTITQAMLTDPNTFIRNHLAGQKIVATTVIVINTQQPPPMFGGGTDNIAFLQGDAPANPPNAQTIAMSATFWIETVEVTLIVPPFRPGQAAFTIPGTPTAPGQPVPTFLVRPPIELTAPRQITFTFTQIQYSQVVVLNFNGLTWPHVSVATLVPAGNVPVPASAWT